jgi:predicted RNA-binding Zn ribbon-like protein
MTGETSVDAAFGWREPAALQPGNRPPAPGDLALVQAFINSHYDLEFSHGADLFVTPRALGEWLARRGLMASAPGRERLSAGDLTKAVTVREGLRSLARGNGGAGASAAKDEALAALDRAARGVALEVRFAPDGPRLVPAAEAGPDRALGIVLAVTVRAVLDGNWARLKVCPGQDCGWAFYDHSRNQSGHWCSMAVCGGRAKARAHYRRRRGPVR